MKNTPADCFVIFEPGLAPQPGDEWLDDEWPLFTRHGGLQSTWRFGLEVGRCLACGTDYDVPAARDLPVVAVHVRGGAYVDERRCACGGGVWTDAEETRVWHRADAQFAKLPTDDSPTGALGTLLHRAMRGVAAPFELIVELSKIDADPVVAAWRVCADPIDMVSALVAVDGARAWWAVAAMAQAGGYSPVASDRRAGGRTWHDAVSYAMSQFRLDVGESSIPLADRAWLCDAVRAACAPPTSPEFDGIHARRRR